MKKNEDAADGQQGPGKPASADSDTAARHSYHPERNDENNKNYQIRLPKYPKYNENFKLPIRLPPDKSVPKKITDYPEGKAALSRLRMSDERRKDLEQEASSLEEQISKANERLYEIRRTLMLDDLLRKLT